MQNEASPSASQRMTSFALSANPSVSERESKQLDLVRIFRKRIDRSTSVNLRSARISGFERMREKKKWKEREGISAVMSLGEKKSAPSLPSWCDVTTS